MRTRYGVERIARLGSNENPYGPSPGVRAALARLADEVRTYPDPSSTGLKAAIGAHHGLAPSRVLVGNGSENLLEVLCLAFLDAGDRVVTQTPSFGLHVIYPQMMEAVVEKIPLDAELRYDVDAWIEAAASGPKMLILCNPSNPVGCRCDADAFARIVAATPEDTLIVVDEAYVEYAVHDPVFPDALASLRSRSGPWIVLRTFSKAWGLAGLRVGYGLASDSVLAGISDRVRTPFNINQAAQMAALAAWKDPAHMEQAVAFTVRERERLAATLRSARLPGLRIAPSVANFLWLDLGRPNGPVYESLLALGMITKAWTEPGFETCIRVSVGRPADNDDFATALAELLRT